MVIKEIIPAFLKNKLTASLFKKKEILVFKKGSPQAQNR